jgi:PhnB protein
MQSNPYLYFNGECEAAFKFYKQCLGGKIAEMMTYSLPSVELDKRLGTSRE